MKKDKKVIILLVSVLLIVIYFSGVFYYKNRFHSRVSVNEINIGGLTLQKADKKLEKSDLWDKLTIKSDTQEFLTITEEEIDYKYISTPGLSKIFDEQNEWKWFLSIFKKPVYTTPILSSYNKDKVKKMIDGIEELDKKLLDAKVVYSSSSDAFVIEPHSYEIKLTKEQLFDLVSESIEKRDSEVNIEKNIEQPTIFDNDKSLITAKNKANEYLKLQLKYDFGDREELIDRSILKDFITIKEKEVDIDPEKVKEYVAELARKYDTYGKGREFKTSTGRNITTSGGSYGWLTHRGKTVDELIKHIKSGENKTIEPIYSYEALIRNSNDIGDSYVEIDLKEQMVYVYIKGQLKVKTPTVTGNVSKGYNTPPGVYPLNYKETDAVLKGEGYASPVKYWMPFNGNIGLHDADWRSSFGGNIYENNGSHGCINLPPSNAKTIFDLVYPGMPVIVH
ncbi:L,D-transpeptidase family protein [Tissierella creatinophila]|uniref:L,D-TPase catalytic domain-containing protein n=1 Tax=Tissierella creatinophila DSM 6911 TaxID=1123403 RepID=A0A1U7M7M6_TISCR|nr:L,D-transpeptidase family protein [Tissierella creatinophila]OLS03286.1 hypothetical protein TICRE_07140 [Tissierella creatinophila DSM 6911]